ncbi:MAG TPA: RNA polymerase sigma factor [Polyangium sp.]|nr:RNA polymerase sigma factor [Polyangium sp.]
MMPTLSREEVTDEVLMLRFQGGDQSAFAKLVRRHKTPVYNFILRSVRSREVAEDLVQDVFVKVVQNATEFKHEARFSTWTYTIARNVCIDHLRKAALRKHPSLDQVANNNSGEDGPTLGERIADAHFASAVDRVAIGSELGKRITRAVEELPPEQREVFLLREVANVPFKEIAEIVGVPENTTKSRMRYALERLQQALAEYEDYARALR